MDVLPRCQEVQPNNVRPRGHLKSRQTWLAGLLPFRTHDGQGITILKSRDGCTRQFKSTIPFLVWEEKRSPYAGICRRSRCTSERRKLICGLGSGDLAQLSTAFSRGPACKRPAALWKKFL